MAASNSAVLKPNLAFSPALSAHLPVLLAQEPDADADEGFDAELPGERDDLPQFFELLDHHDHLLVQLGAEQRHANEAGVLVTVADDQAAELVLHGQPGEQLRLAADFQAELERLARHPESLPPPRATGSL